MVSVSQSNAICATSLRVKVIEVSPDAEKAVAQKRSAVRRKGRAVIQITVVNAAAASGGGGSRG
jgi:phage FluMu gp28-like protein